MASEAFSRTGAIEQLAPKVSALERWVSEDVAKLISAECQPVAGALAAIQRELEMARAKAGEAEAQLEARIHQAEAGLDAARRDAAELVRGLPTQESVAQDRVRLTEHIETQVGRLSGTQQEHMECVHKLIHNSQESLKSSIVALSEETMAKCDQLAAANRTVRTWLALAGVWAGSGARARAQGGRAFCSNRVFQAQL